VRARVVDPNESKEPAWARPGWQPEDPGRAQFLDDDDGYRAWFMEREAGIAPGGPHAVWNEFGHTVYRRMPLGVHPLFGWRL
jgi:hypothetical protein